MDINTLRELISYSPLNGKVEWNFRRQKFFNRFCDYSSWNKKYSFREAGSFNSEGYGTITILGKQYNLHRIIWFYMLGRWPDQVDHIDGNPSNNRWDNLREVNNIENGRNRKINKNNSTGFVGVNYEKGRYRARIKINGCKINLGSYVNIDDAIRVRKEAESEYGFHRNHGRKR